MKENAPEKIRFQTLRTLWLPLAIGVVTVAALGCRGGYGGKDQHRHDGQPDEADGAGGAEHRRQHPRPAGRIRRPAGLHRQGTGQQSVPPHGGPGDTIRDVWLENSNGEVIYSCYGLSAVCDVLITRTENISYWQYHSGDEHYLVMKKKAGVGTACLV